MSSSSSEEKDNHQQLINQNNLLIIEHTKRQNELQQELDIHQQLINENAQLLQKLQEKKELAQILHQQKVKLLQQREFLSSFSKEVIISDDQKQAFSSLQTELFTCQEKIMKYNVSNLENDAQIQITKELASSIGKVIENINSAKYLFKLNAHSQVLLEKLELLSKFKEEFIEEQIVEDFYNDASSKPKEDPDIQKLINTTLLRKPLTVVDDMLSNSKKLLDPSIQNGIFSILVNYQEQLTNCNRFLQEVIPFIIERFDYFQKIVQLMDEFPTFTSRITTLQRAKNTMNRSLKKLKLDIDGYKEDLKDASTDDVNEINDLNQQLTEALSKQSSLKQEEQRTMEELNAISMKLFQLKSIDFNIGERASSGTTDRNSLLYLLYNVNVKEMSPESFKSITPMLNNMNHPIYVGTDEHDIEHVIKKYSLPIIQTPQQEEAGVGGGGKKATPMSKLKKELRITTKLKHPNIISIEGIYTSKDTNHEINAFIVMPHYPNGNLKEFIEKQRKSSQQSLDFLFWERTWRQVLTAIQHVHSRGVIHCDIKPENIFVGANSQQHTNYYPIVLGDFDISLDDANRTMNLYARTARTCVPGSGSGVSGTFDYLSPELMNQQQAASYKSDMYAFGKTIKNCMTGEELAAMKSLNDLVNQCLQTNPDDRPYASEALSSDFFTKELLTYQNSIQNQAISIANQSKQLKDYEEQLMEMKNTMDKEAENLKRDIRKLEQKKVNTEKEKQEISAKHQQLRIKEAQIQQMKLDLEKSSAKQLQITLPSYWKRNAFDQFPQIVYIEDVTKQMQAIMQEIINATCNSATLGRGRDQITRMSYSQLVVKSVSRIENANLFSSYQTKMNQLASYQDPSNRFQVQTENLPNTSNSREWMKTVGLNLNLNEKYLWHGTKPEIVPIITEHGFDERLSNLSGLFGAGVYFAESCSKSDQYCTPDQQQEYTLLLCRVILGKQIYHTPQHMSNNRRPPVIDGSNSRTYDSVIGKSNASSTSYRELIVYDGYQCYPEFIVKYKRV